MDLRLNGLVAVVCGSSKGLGFATAKQLALEGAAVVINGRNPEQLEKAKFEIQSVSRSPVLTVAGDLSQKDTPQKLVTAAIEAFGRLDILITNTGGPSSGKFEELTDEQWQQAVDLVFLSHVRMIHAALPYLKQSPSPAVLTVTSYSVKQPIPNLILSNSVRAATVGLTKSLALELGDQGIRFNSILPGWTETERVAHLMESRAKSNNTSVEEEIQKQMSSSPFKRMAAPQEFANAAVFLVSPAASYITGTMLAIDGGMYKGTL